VCVCARARMCVCARVCVRTRVCVCVHARKITNRGGFEVKYQS